MRPMSVLAGSVRDEHVGLVAAQLPPYDDEGPFAYGRGRVLVMRQG